MVNRLLPLAAALLLSVAANAQLKDSGSLTLSIGPSFPLGKFAKEEPSENSSGFAKGGMFVNIAYAHSLSKKFGVTAMLHLQQNGLNTGAMETRYNRAWFFSGFEFTNIVQPQRRPQIGGPIFKDWNFEKAYWGTASVLLGAYGKFPLSKSQKLSAIIRTAIGPAYLASPEIHGECTTDSSAASITQEASHGFGLAYSLGGTLQYNLKGNFYLRGGVDFFGTNIITVPDVKVTLVTKWGTDPLTYQGQQMTMTQDTKQSITTLNASVGVGLRF